jgi:hypothetical protein
VFPNKNTKYYHKDLYIPGAVISDKMLEAMSVEMRPRATVAGAIITQAFSNASLPPCSPDIPFPQFARMQLSDSFR